MVIVKHNKQIPLQSTNNIDGVRSESGDDKGNSYYYYYYYLKVRTGSSQDFSLVQISHK